MMEWRQVVEENVRPLSRQSLPLVDGFGRVVAADLFSAVSVPVVPESLRDGYLCYRADLQCAVDKGLPVVFEVAAGTTDVPVLQRGEAQRIFTGGQVRSTGEQCCVLPLEICREEDGRFFPARTVCTSGTPPFLLQRGAEISVGECLAREGQRLDGGELARIASAGEIVLPVFTLPRVALCCTGTELIPPGELLQPGQKYSVNDLILRNGLRCCGADLISCRISDDLNQVIAFFQAASGYDLLLSTGGLGPGKFDLVRRAFLAAGGEILLESLAMRPGKTIIFGRLGDTLVMSLPGPPRAVETLLYELVLPVVRLLSGEKEVWPRKIQVKLMTTEKKSSPVLRLRPGLLCWHEGGCQVGAAEAGGVVDCHILYPPGRLVKKGEFIDVHLTAGSGSRRNWHGHRG